ncbi:unnamed protein product, partial [Allacma fusca]
MLREVSLFHKIDEGWFLRNMSRLLTGQANDWWVYASPEIVRNLDNENSHARFAQFVRDLKVMYPEDDVQKKAKEVNKFRNFKFGTETPKDYVVAKQSLFYKMNPEMTTEKKIHYLL